MVRSDRQITVIEAELRTELLSIFCSKFQYELGNLHSRLRTLRISFTFTFSTGFTPKSGSVYSRIFGDLSN